jgi:hypothetical protein
MSDLKYFQENAIIPPPDVKLFEEHAVIQPPDFKNVNIPKRKFKYIIDSRDRNTKRYPNPAKYTLHLDHNINDVIMIQIYLLDVPFNNYNITKYNNTLHFLDKSSTVIDQYSITPGNYTASTLIEALNNALIDLTTNIRVATITYNEITEKIKIEANEDLQLGFKSPIQIKYDESNAIDKYMDNSIGRVLGFGIDNYEIGANDELEAPYTINLKTDDYMTMYIATAKNYYSINQHVHEAFAVINNPSNGNLINVSEELMKKSYFPALPSMKTFSIKFKDYYGNLYDFQNKEHRFEIIFTCYKQTRSYNEIFDT